MKIDQIFEIVQFEKLMNFQNLTLRKIKKKKNIKCYTLAYLKIINFTIWKISISQLEKLINCENNLWIMRK